MTKKKKDTLRYLASNYFSKYIEEYIVAYTEIEKNHEFCKMQSSLKKKTEK